MEPSSRNSSDARVFSEENDPQRRSAQNWKCRADLDDFEKVGEWALGYKWDKIFDEWDHNCAFQSPPLAARDRPFRLLPSKKPMFRRGKISSISEYCPVKIGAALFLKYRIQLVLDESIEL